MSRTVLLTCVCAVLFLAALHSVAAADWPELPEKNAALEIPAQEWPQKPGPRTVTIAVHYPGGKLANVDGATGIFLTLHNWGGTGCAGTANPDALANRLNVVAICVDYLQSGLKASVKDPEPYDFGYLQGLDALRALWFVYDGLDSSGRSFAKRRLFAAGGSGGGNVTLMVNKLAPRTFSCVIDMCGMPKLSHDIAFNLPGGSGLNARWSRDPNSPNYLSPDAQEIRFNGHPAHLETMKSLGSSNRIIVVHGSADNTCPFPDAQEMVANMQAAGLDVVPHFLKKEDLDGKVFTSTGHALGNRTEIAIRVGGEFIQPGNERVRLTDQKNDFERKKDIRYDTVNGAYVISYENGYPIGRFEPAATDPEYRNHQDLVHYLDANGKRHSIESRETWQIRRSHILNSMQRVMGRVPPVTARIPLKVKTLSESDDGVVLRRKLSFQSDPYDRVTAWLLTPSQSTQEKRPAVLCLHQTVKAGKDEPVGLTGKPTMHYAIELAKRGFVTLSPDYPSLGEHAYEFQTNPEYVSGTMKAVWDNMRAVDLLSSLPQVDADRIGVIGHSLGGHGAMFTAAFEPRLKAIVSSCGFTRFHKDDVPSWTGPRYMPRIASDFENSADKVPFDFPEIVAAFAPRPFLAVAATHDRDFDVSGVRDSLKSAAPIYALFDATDNLSGVYPDSPHDFPDDARRQAYEFLERHLKN